MLFRSVVVWSCVGALAGVVEPAVPDYTAALRDPVWGLITKDGKVARSNLYLQACQKLVTVNPLYIGGTCVRQ